MLLNNTTEDLCFNSVCDKIEEYSPGAICRSKVSRLFVKHIAACFYLLDPESNIYENVDDVPNYEVQLIPAFGLIIVLEQLTRCLQKRETSRLSDLVLNTGSGLMFVLTRIFLSGFVIGSFKYLHTNYRLVDLPLNSLGTWFLSLLLVEFAYYWAHRTFHGVNLFWAAHQFHHSAEDYNVTATFRDNVIDFILYDIFPIPLAVIIPPPILAIHSQFSLIVQFWLHNDVCGSLGPLEHLIMTPSLHKIHHGRNPLCIDKNFGALLFFWDYVFGTYEPSRPKEKLVLGVVSGVSTTFDPMTLHFEYFGKVWKKFKELPGWANKFKAVFYGPGWAPGKPRLGLITDVPEINPDDPFYAYNPFLEYWKSIYVIAHSVIIGHGFYLLVEHPAIKFTYGKSWAGMVYLVFALTSFGQIFDRKHSAPIMEIFRCAMFFLYDAYVVTSFTWQITGNLLMLLNAYLFCCRLFHVLTIIGWIIYLIVNRPDQNNNYKKTDEEPELKVNKVSNTSVVLSTLGAVFVVALYFGSWMVLNIEECRTVVNSYSFSFS